jgi:hypothetical protein
MAEKLLLNDPGEMAGVAPELVVLVDVFVVELLELPQPAATRPATAAIAAPRITFALMLPSFVGFPHCYKPRRYLSTVVNKT